MKIKYDHPVVYCITCIPNGKFYVGASSDFESRLKKHTSSLVFGTHHCSEMQADYDRYGESEFEARIIEVCEKAVLHERELFWMNKTKAIEHGYNTTASAHHHAIDSRKEVSAMSPDGREVRQFRCMGDMADELGVGYESVAGMFCGQHPHVKGWTLPDAVRQKIYSPEGEEFSFSSATLFRAMYGRISIQSLLSGRKKSSLGWTLHPKSTKEEKAKPIGTPPKPITMLDPQGNEITFTSRKDARKFIGADKSNFIKAIKAGKRIKGWGEKK